MEIFFKDGENILKHLINVGEKWDAQQINNPILNSIFKNIDNGDRIASDSEIIHCKKFSTTTQIQKQIVILKHNTLMRMICKLFLKE